MDLNSETITSNHYEVFLPFLVQSPWTADPPELDPILQSVWCITLYSHSFDAVVSSDWSPYDVAWVMWLLPSVVWRHCARCVDTKKTLLLYCWLHVCCGRCLAMGLHVTVLTLAYLLSEGNCNWNFLIQVHCWKSSVATNSSPHYHHILNVISSLLTFFDICFSS
jgi:hypothetical protein